MAAKYSRVVLMKTNVILNFGFAKNARFSHFLPNFSRGIQKSRSREPRITSWGSYEKTYLNTRLKIQNHLDGGNWIELKLLGTTFIVRVVVTIWAVGRGASDFDCPSHCNIIGSVYAAVSVHWSHFLNIAVLSFGIFSKSLKWISVIVALCWAWSLSKSDINNEQWFAVLWIFHESQQGAQP